MLTAWWNGIQEAFPVAAGGDAGIKDDNHAFVRLTADETPAALAKFQYDRFHQGMRRYRKRKAHDNDIT